jgi:hypothetical protein
VRDLENHRYLDHLAVVDWRDRSKQQPAYIDEFVHQMPLWLTSHATNQITGLEQFVTDFSYGTTQGFDSFYLHHHGSRMRCLVGEYFYHVRSWIANQCRWSFVTEQDPLRPGDALVLSMPFCDTGNAVRDYATLMQQCDLMGIPVLIDACYYPISSGIQLDLNHDCIKMVVFSLSKCFPVANLRIGVRFRRADVSDGQSLYHDLRYINSFSAFVGQALIHKFPCDYIPTTYQYKQQKICTELGLQPSQSVLFGIGNTDWNQYNRSHLLKIYQIDLDPTMFVNRISLTALFDNWDIVEELGICN